MSRLRVIPLIIWIMLALSGQACTTIPTGVVSARLLTVEPSLSQYWSWDIAQWWPEIRDAADQYYMDYDLVAAVMKYESNGNQDARGAAGEIGLMQIMPKYHSCVSWTPRRNILCGTHILATYYHEAEPKYPDSPWRAALAAYNKGITGRDRDGKGWEYADKVLTYYNEAKAYGR